MKILVTGASGFIGNELLKHLAFASVIAVSRTPQKNFENVEWKHFSLETLLKKGTFSGNYDVAIHLAGRAHILNENSDNPLAEFRKVNKNISLELVKQLVANGLKRFIFVSSIGVNGVTTENESPFTENSIVKPHSPYAISKYEAEVELIKLAKKLSFELVIVRPPLVYGKNAPGNFGKLVEIVKTQLPLPFGAINNKRSYVSVANLASFLEVCVTHPKAANETFLISDGFPVSTTALLKKLNKCFGGKAILLPIPKILLNFVFLIFGKKSMAVQLLDDWVVDTSKASSLLGWYPIESMDDALQKITR